MFKLIKRMKIENCKLDFKENLCFMYGANNGITPKDLEEAFEGRRLLVYRWTKGEKGVLRKKKCPWCGSIQKDLVTHIEKEHLKGYQDLAVRIMQENLYKLLLKKIRAGYYFATSYTNQECQFCIHPVVKGREGICAVPESSRNKVMSFKVMGFSCDGFKKEWNRMNNVVYLIL